MYALTLAIAVMTHQPNPGDGARFGYPEAPGNVSVAYWHWRAAKESYEELRDSPFNIRIAWDDGMRIALDEAWYRTRVYDAVWTMTDPVFWAETRIKYARQLRDQIGPVDYYFGRLPSPVLEYP